MVLHAFVVTTVKVTSSFCMPFALATTMMSNDLSVRLSKFVPKVIEAPGPASCSCGVTKRDRNDVLVVRLTLTL